MNTDLNTLSSLQIPNKTNDVLISYMHIYICRVIRYNNYDIYDNNILNFVTNNRMIMVKNKNIFLKESFNDELCGLDIFPSAEDYIIGKEVTPYLN